MTDTPTQTATKPQVEPSEPTSAPSPDASVSGEPGPPILTVKDLSKTFHIGFFRKKVPAVRGVSFEVRPGEIFGLLGPNGAGKTTSIKCILRLIHPDSGEIRIFGKPPGDREAVKRVGYMPENPYIYQYLKPMEFLDLCGRLVGMDKDARTRRAEALLAQVGLAHAIDRPIGKFSKGMMQRVGLAQALLHDPELLVLDEPMSGLDPIGRKQVRDLLLEQRARGKTLIFTSHILSDVEMLCDRVTILQHGEVTAAGSMDALLHRGDRRFELQLADVSAALRAELTKLGKVHEHGGSLVVTLAGQSSVEPALRVALEGGATVESMVPHRETLEDYFVRGAASPGEPNSTPPHQDPSQEPSRQGGAARA